jgi:hypothetical protein
MRKINPSTRKKLQKDKQMLHSIQMKKLLFTLLLSAFAFAGCTTKDNSFKSATGASLADKVGGVQTTGSAAPAETPVSAAIASPTPNTP